MTKRPSIYRPARYGKPFARPEVQRPSSSKRGYGRKWRFIRAKFLKTYPTCGCGAPATEVDHIVAKSKGGGNEWSNLQPMCKPCHSRKTVAVDGALGKRNNRSGSTDVDPCSKKTLVSTKFMFEV
jgi:5-methylcytosine-specific restriction enzyme A